MTTGRAKPCGAVRQQKQWQPRGSEPARLCVRKQGAARAPGSASWPRPAGACPAWPACRRPGRTGSGPGAPGRARALARPAARAGCASAVHARLLVGLSRGTHAHKRRWIPCCLCRTRVAPCARYARSIRARVPHLTAEAHVRCKAALCRRLTGLASKLVAADERGGP